LSSTTSTRRPASVDGGSQAGGTAAAPNQASKPNTLPRPTSLSTSIRPPISETSRAEIARPSPVPP
jgi:hypothetical protein